MNTIQDKITVDLADHARLSDPHTSQEAAQQLHFAKDLCAVVLEALKKNPGTFEEIARQTGLRPDQVWRRLPDLQRANLARPSTVTKRGSSGRSQRVWEAV
jgi:predicted ArsR family transcriptional regulator